MFENVSKEIKKQLREKAINAILQDCASILEARGYIGYVDAWMNTISGEITFTRYERECERIDLSAINSDFVWVCGVKSEICG